MPPSDESDLPSWLHDFASVPTDLTTQLVALRLCEAVAIGLLIGLVYFIAQRKRFSEGIAFATTTILLTILVAMSTMVIGSNVARAFSLVGALSIVRFRTVVEDTRDTAFVIFAVVAGMAIGAGNFGVCLIGVPLVSLTAIGLAYVANGIGRTEAETHLEVRLGGGLDPATTLADSFAEFTSETHLLSAATARQGAAIEVRYRLRLKSACTPLELLRAVNRIEGVQHVEIRTP